MIKLHVYSNAISSTTRSYLVTNTTITYLYGMKTYSSFDIVELNDTHCKSLQIDLFINRLSDIHVHYCVYQSWYINTSIWFTSIHNWKLLIQAQGAMRQNLRNVEVILSIFWKVWKPVWKESIVLQCSDVVISEFCGSVRIRETNSSWRFHWIKDINRDNVK